MKTFALAVVLGASLVSTAAFAGEQRPTYLAFSAPTAAPATSNAVTPAAPKVRKSDGIFGHLPLFVPLAAGLSILGLVAALSTGKNGSPG